MLIRESRESFVQELPALQRAGWRLIRLFAWAGKHSVGREPMHIEASLERDPSQELIDAYEMEGKYNAIG